MEILVEVMSGKIIMLEVKLNDFIENVKVKF